MLKKTVSVSDFIRRAEVIKSLAIVAFDNPGGPDEGKTGDDFSEDMLPEEMKESFQKYKQYLIDKGVNIGIAREKEKAEKLKGSEVENFLKEQGISKEDIETLKPYLAKHKSFAKLYEAYGTEDIDEIVQAIEAAEQEGLSDIDKIKKELDKANSEKEDLKSQISALQKSLGDKDLTISEKEQKLTSFVEKTVVNSAIKQAAIEAGAYDPDDVLDRIKGQVKLEIEGEDYIPYVVDEKGVKRFDSNGDPVTIASLVNEFLEKRPHLRKSTLSGGAGSKGGTGKQVSTAKFTAEQLKDPKFFQEHYKEIMAEVKSGNLKI